MNAPDPIARQQKLVEQFPNNELARYSLAKALYEQSRWAEAKEHFALAIARKPDWMVAYILQGKCALNLGDKAGAKANFERARDLAREQSHEGPLAEMEEVLRTLE